MMAGAALVMMLVLLGKLDVDAWVSTPKRTAGVEVQLSTGNTARLYRWEARP